MMGDLTKNFSKEEFACPCCGEFKMDNGLVAFLQAVREYVDTPLKINSGFRCEKHNREVGGRSSSEHLTGMAVDVACTSSRLRYELISNAMRAGITRLGIADTFIHIGVSSEHPQKVVWVY